MPSNSAALSHPLLGFLFRRPPDPESDRNVLPGGHMRKERRILEDHCDVAVSRRNPFHLAPGDGQCSSRRGFKAGDEAKESRFSATRRTGENEKFLLVYTEREVGERADRHCPGAGKDFGQLLSDYERHGRSLRSLPPWHNQRVSLERPGKKAGASWKSPRE